MNNPLDGFTAFVSQVTVHHLSVLSTKEDSVAVWIRTAWLPGELYPAGGPAAIVVDWSGWDCTEENRRPVVRVSLTADLRL